MLDRVQIRRLRDAGHTLEDIAATVGVAKRSVQVILKEPPVTSPESAPTPRGPGESGDRARSRAFRATWNLSWRPSCRCRPLKSSAACAAPVGGNRK